jgi:hypothetical protein
MSIYFLLRHLVRIKWRPLYLFTRRLSITYLSTILLCLLSSNPSVAVLSLNPFTSKHLHLPHLAVTGGGVSLQHHLNSQIHSAQSTNRWLPFGLALDHLSLSLFSSDLIQSTPSSLFIFFQGIWYASNDTICIYLQREGFWRILSSNPNAVVLSLHIKTPSSSPFSSHMWWSKEWRWPSTPPFPKSTTHRVWIDDFLPGLLYITWVCLSLVQI